MKVIYSLLALLLGGGLIFFGIGGATGGGGLLDAVNQQGDNVNSLYSKQIDTLNRQVAANPKNQNAWREIARLQVQQASVVGYNEQTTSYTAEGKAELQKASVAWKRYLALNPKRVDANTAAIMVNAYGPGGLNDPKAAANALKDSIAGRKPSSALYAQLALLAYQAGDKNESRLAEQRALELAPKDRRAVVKAELAAQKAQVDAYLKQQQQQQQQQQPGLGG